MNTEKRQKVAIVGLGYVGLPLAYAVEASGHYQVLGFDVSTDRVDMIKRGENPLKEDAAFNEDFKKRTVKVSSDENDLTGTDIFILCVPTPVKSDKSPDLTPVTSAAKMVAKYLKPGALVLLESTVNPGISEEVVLPILEEVSQLRGGRDFELAHCPERIDPGNKQWNVYNIPRNIGALTKEGTKRAADFYRSFIKAPVREMSSLKAAESTKIVENAFRDINIAFVNELAKSFDNFGLDLKEVIEGSSSKPFAFMPHFPGCGVGGHCIPVDPYYLIARAQQEGFTHHFLRIAREVNESMPEYTVELLRIELNKLELPMRNAKIGLLGLSYKRDVGDVRESPALQILKHLQKHDAKVETYDPYIIGQRSINSLDEILTVSDHLVIACDHTEFKQKLTPETLRKFSIKVVLDGRNCLDKEAIKAAGIQYKGIGR